MKRLTTEDIIALAMFTVIFVLMVISMRCWI